MTLQLPTILYGRYREVRPRLMRIAGRMRRGEEWIPLVEQQGFLDVACTPGYIVGDGPSSLLGAEEHFQMWLLWMLARRGGVRDIREIEEDIFRRSLSRPWAVLGLVMSCNHNWLRDESRHHAFLRAVYPLWDDFLALGPRYTLGSRSASELWQLHNTVMYVLANQGIDAQRLAAFEATPSLPKGRGAPRARHQTASLLAGFMEELGIKTNDANDANGD